MSLNKQIKSDIKDAMRAKDVLKRDTLRNIQVLVKQIEVDERREVTDSDVEKLLLKYAKQREDAIVQFREAKRDDLVAKDQEELKIVKSYLPEPMDDAQLQSIISTIIATLGATSMKDMGKVMGSAKEAVGSRADGGRINIIVKKLLS